MGIFSRFRDIISSNLNAMLEKAEDPEKLIKLMIQEMEDTLVEIKASCAGAMASRAKVLRASEDAKDRADKWNKKAQIAITKGREDLAREALMEKRAASQEVERRETELSHFEDLVAQYKSDISQLEDKLAAARNKHRILVQRHIHAGRRHEAQSRIRKVDSNDAFVRFEKFESRIDRMEADADLVNFGSKDLEDEFDQMETDEEIEAELDALKKKSKSKDSDAS